MSDQEELSELLAGLTSSAPQDWVVVLQVLVEDPTGDTRVRAALGERLTDRTVAVLAIPATHGEIRCPEAQQ